MARFPEKPTLDEQEALRSFIHLFARLYPWYGDSSFVSTLLFHVSVQHAIVPTTNSETAANAQNISSNI
jgi:hypothetical protein